MIKSQSALYNAASEARGPEKGILDLLEAQHEDIACRKLLNWLMPLIKLHSRPRDSAANICLAANRSQRIVRPCQGNQSDYDFLLANAQCSQALRLPYFVHLDQPIGLWSYIEIADDIAEQLPDGHLLDWGCGFGQMTYLLRRRGLQVTAYDLGDPDKVSLPDIPLCRELDVIHSSHPTALPFADDSFDAVLSCGVLEHVDESSQPGNEMESLHEIARVLRPGGLLFIYQLPQRYAWKEALIRRFHLGYAHPRRYTIIELQSMLAQSGFCTLRMRRANLIPKNLTGMPSRLRTMYSHFSIPLLELDRVVCRIPGLCHLAGVLHVTAQRRTG